MQAITLISGSTLGSAEFLADHLALLLAQAGFTPTVLHGPEPQQLAYQGLWLLITSTHGAGQLPDNLAPLFDHFEQTCPDLSQVQYGIIGLGDSNYDTFCLSAKRADEQLTQWGAHKIGQRLEIDAAEPGDPESYAEMWLPQWLASLSAKSR